MNQYWRCVNIDKKEFLECQGDILQMGHSWSYDPFLLAITHLLEGHWQSDRVVCIGDYTTQASINGLDNLYEDTLTHLDDITNMAHEFLPSYGDVENNPFAWGRWKDYCDDYYHQRVLAAVDKKLHLDLGAYFSREQHARGNEMIEHPLSLLLAAPGGRGGGDYPYPDDYGYGLFSGLRVGVFGADSLPTSTSILDDIWFCEDIGQRNARALTAFKPSHTTICI